MDADGEDEGVVLAVAPGEHVLPHAFDIVGVDIAVL